MGLNHPLQAPTPGAREKPARRFGDYEVIARLGAGGMAEVFLARALAGPRQGWTVAIKRLLPELAADYFHQDSFAQEASLSQLLNHPNIVTVYEVGMVSDTSFIAMEHVDGRDVGQILRRCAQQDIQLPVDFAVYLAKTLLEALDYAHHVRGRDGKPQRIVHCDVSPSNVFISRTGDIKLGDFGVARTYLSHQSNLPVGGKASYLSPEALDGKIDARADLWAAAITLHEMLTLEKPKRFSRLRKLRPDASEPLEALLKRALAKKPKDRFQSAAEFARALEPLYDERIGTPLAIAAVVRGLFGANDVRTTSGSHSG